MPTGYVQAGFIQSRPIGLVAIAFCLAVLAGCGKPTSSSVAAKSAPATEPINSPVAQADAEYEALVRHLLRRVSDANKRILILQNDMLRQESQYLDDEYEILQGRPTPKHDPEESRRRRMKDDLDNLHRQAQDMLDVEAFIELHNRTHPESPQADVKDILRMQCGDCEKDRSKRDADLRAEAPN
jgi:hypothetical protein